MSLFWIIYFVGVVFFTILSWKISSEQVKKYYWIDYIGLLLFGLLWPCFILSIIGSFCDILIG